MICAKNRRTQIGIASTFSNELTDTLTQCRFQKDAEEEHRPSKSPHDLFLLSRTHRRRRMHLCTEFVFATGLNLGPPAATVALERQPADRGTTDPESAPTRNGAFWMVERTDGRSDGGAAPDRETVPVEGRRRAATHARAGGRRRLRTFCVHDALFRCRQSRQSSYSNATLKDGRRRESCVTFLGKFGRQHQQC